MTPREVEWRVRLARNGGTIGTVAAPTREAAYGLAVVLAKAKGADPGTVILEIAYVGRS